MAQLARGQRSTVRRHHKVQCPVLRLGLNDVDHADGAALSTIHAEQQFRVKSRTVFEEMPWKSQGNYRNRLMDSGVSCSEVEAQCKDPIFACIDSIRMNLRLFVGV